MSVSGLSNTGMRFAVSSITLMVMVAGSASVAYAQGDEDEGKADPTATAPTMMIVCDLSASDTDDAGEPVRDDGCQEVPVGSEVHKPKPRFKFKVNVHPPDGKLCTRETPTGSSRSEVVCRSPQQAYWERRAAQEQLKETIRDGR